MKNCLITLLLSSPCFLFSQRTDREAEIDTTSKTQIERLLRETSIIKKVEFVEVQKVVVLNFQIIIVTNLKTNTKFKGLYLSNQVGASFWTGINNKGEHHAYLDEGEIDDLIGFLENCDAKWKNDKPTYQTQYEFETLHNLLIRFWTPKNSKSWTFEVKFSSYIFNNTETLGKKQSDDLLDALRQVKAELKNH